MRALKADNEKKNAILQTQKFTPAELECFNMGRRDLQRQVESVEKEIEGCDKQIWAEEMTIGKSQERVSA